MIGQTISHYKILEKLGEGGMGEVYLAEDTALDRKVALKFLPSQYTSDPELNKRFRREAKAAAALNHPNIITVYEIGEHEGRAYIAMEYVQGESLRNIVGATGRSPLPFDQIINIIIQLCDGLNAAHQAGITHRDIKPENIIIDKSGRVRILDFGLARMAGGSKLTKEATTLGTISYMAPEQFRGQPTDHRTDIWAVGVVLYEMLAGELPFQGESEEAVMYMVLSEEPAPISKRRNDLPVDLEQIVFNCLEKTPASRYQKASDILIDLGRFREESEVGSKIVRSTTGKRKIARRRFKRISVTAAIALVMMLGFMLLKSFVFKEAPVSEPRSIAVISFQNMTGDSTYNYLQNVIPNLFITSLEQSPNLRVATWERLRDLSKQIGKTEVDVGIIAEDLGFDLCRQAGINLIVTGSYTLAGDLFVTDAKVLEVATRELIKGANSKGTGVASILDIQIDEISAEITKGIGLSTRKTVVIPTRIAEITTPSLEAYNFFIRGREEYYRVNPWNAVVFLTKAIELDSTFASAYLYLGLSEILLRNTKARNIAYEKAKKYRVKASTKEQLYIDMSYAWVIEYDTDKVLRILNQMSTKYPNEKTVFQTLGSYYNLITKNYDKAIPAYEKALELDPYYPMALNRLAYVYVSLGRYEKALKYFQRLTIASPGDANPFDSMADCYFAMGKIEEARLKYKKATDIDKDFIWSYFKRAYIHALREDYSTALEICDQATLSASTAGFKALEHYWKGFYLFWLGQMGQALQELQNAEVLWGEVENTNEIAHIEWIKAWISFDRGNYDFAKKQMKKWFTAMSSYSPPRIPRYKTFYKFHLGFFELQQGFIDSAAIRLQQIKTLLPDVKENARSDATFQQKTLEAEILLKRGATAQAIELYNSMEPFDTNFGNQWDWLPYNVPFYHDLQARAYVKNGEIELASAEYNRLITFDPGKRERYLIQPRYHYRLAQLYEKSGEANDAIRQYQRFLEIWNNADEDLPELINARERLEHLKEASMQ